MKPVWFYVTFFLCPSVTISLLRKTDLIVEQLCWTLQEAYD